MARILVADDDIDIRELIEIVLARAGHEVGTAMDGLQAVDLYARMQPDLVVLDLRMPGLSGIEVTRAVREQPGGSAPILLVTASATHADLVEARAAGICDHLIKPFKPAALRERVAELLRGSPDLPGSPG